MDSFMTTERESKTRDRRFRSLGALLRHFCHRKDFQRVLAELYDLDEEEGTIPMGCRYADGVIRPAEPLEVPEGKKWVISEGTTAYLHAPEVADKMDVENISVYAYAPPELAQKNAVLRDLLKGIDRPHEREQETEMLLPLMIHAIECADIVVDQRRRLKKRIDERWQEIQRRERGFKGRKTA